MLFRLLGIGTVHKVEGCLSELGSSSSNASAPTTKLYSHALIQTDDGRDVFVRNMVSHSNISGRLGENVTVWVQPIRSLFTLFQRTNMVLVWKEEKRILGTGMLGLIFLPLLPIILALCATAFIGFPSVFLMAVMDLNGHRTAVYWTMAIVAVPIGFIWITVLQIIVPVWRAYRITRREKRENPPAWTADTGRKVVMI